jgi:DNA polymerase-3 subunit beta
MDLTIERTTFLSELQTLQGVIERKNTIPILANILLRAREDRLELTSTDLDLTLHTTAAAKVGSPGAVCVPARKLFDLVRSLAAESIKLKLHENHYLGVTAGSGRYKLVAQPAEDFPTVPQLEGKPALTLPLALWKQMSRRVVFAVSSEEKRFQLSGALLKERSGLELVATDGHRLSLIEFPSPSKKPSLPATLVPKKALVELLKMDAPEDASLSITHSENHLGFAVGHRQLVARLLDVNFPDYEKVLARDHDRTARVSRTELESAVRRISLFSSESVPGVRLTFDEGRLTVSAASQELGEGTESLPAECPGPATSLGLNADYLLDFLAEIDSAEVDVDYKDENSKCVWRPATAVEGATRFVYVVMPMRL